MYADVGGNDDIVEMDGPTGILQHLLKHLRNRKPGELYVPVLMKRDLIVLLNSIVIHTPWGLLKMRYLACVRHRHERI